MLEIISGKDDLEVELSQLKTKLVEASDTNSQLSADLLSERTARASLTDMDDLTQENEKLKQVIKLLEMERDASKEYCKEAMKVMEQNSAHPSPSLDSLQMELSKAQADLQLKQGEVDKLRSREQHFRESNEIFQQKLMVLSEENRKLRGQRINF